MNPVLCWPCDNDIGRAKVESVLALDRQPRCLDNPVNISIPHARPLQPVLLGIPIEDAVEPAVFGFAMLEQ